MGNIMTSAYLTEGVEIPETVGDIKRDNFEITKDKMKNGLRRHNKKDRSTHRSYHSLCCNERNNNCIQV
tara:strand:- start:165 stop:371 length:207 start_codon:yes stop_codon:yes gene_type:complete